jgi:hypothetical protein
MTLTLALTWTGAIAEAQSGTAVADVLTSGKWRLYTIEERNKRKEYGPVHDYLPREYGALPDTGMADSLSFHESHDFRGRIIIGSWNGTNEYADIAGEWKLKRRRILLKASGDYFFYLPDEVTAKVIDKETVELTGENWSDGGHSDFRIVDPGSARQ